MREIKFRVFNGAEMVYDVMTGRFGAFYINPGPKGDGLDASDSASVSPFNTKYSDQIPVMQYTGLKDKNGVEIYEGDIVKAGRELEPWLPMIGTYPVRFENGGYMWDDNWLAEMYPWQELEVIGNIHENPELLKDQTNG